MSRVRRPPLAVSTLCLLVLISPVACSSDTLTSEEWFDEARKARACERDDDCVRLVGVCGCCLVAVNNDHTEYLMELAERVVCEGNCACDAIDYVLCENNLCTGKYR